MVCFPFIIFRLFSLFTNQGKKYSGFKTGGKMVARVTFTFKDDTKVTDVKAQ